MELHLLLKVAALILFAVAAVTQRNIVAAGLACWVATEIF